VESWSNPALVLRFAWRVKAYFLLLAIAWCGGAVLFVGLMMIALAVTPHPKASLITWIGTGMAFMPVGVIWTLWQCPNCKAWLHTRRAYPSAGVECEECGARLYHPNAFYPDPKPLHNPRADARDAKHYWIDRGIQSAFRWRVSAFRAVSGFLATALLVTAGGLFTELWFFWLIGGVMLMTIAWLWRVRIWRCVHCGDRLNEATEYPGRGQVLCHPCGAVLWEAVPASRSTPILPRGPHRDASTAGGAYFHNTESFQRAMSRREDEIGRAIDAGDFAKLSRLMADVETETRRDIQARTDERLRASGRDRPSISGGTRK